MKFHYTVIRSYRRSIALQVDSKCNITVRAPYLCSQKEIDDFIFSKKVWLEKTVIKQREKLKNTKVYTEDEVKILRNKAKEIIPQKVEYYSQIMGVNPNSVKINSAKKRYGSCSGTNNLNFSLYLMDKDEEFINYVVIHELAHIKHHNHSKDFYSFIAQFMPNYKDIVKKNK